MAPNPTIDERLALVRCRRFEKSQVLSSTPSLELVSLPMVDSSHASSQPRSVYMSARLDPHSVTLSCFRPQQSFLKRGGYLQCPAMLSRFYRRGDLYNQPSLFIAMIYCFQVLISLGPKQQISCHASTFKSSGDHPRCTYSASLSGNVVCRGVLLGFRASKLR